MAEASSSLSVLPWIWTIETLASDGEVDPSFLNDVIENAPQLPDDLGGNMIEMVALRCLEGLYSSRDGSTNKVFLGVEPKLMLDPSERCESLLHFIFNKTPNLSVAGDEQHKLDIHSFIMHKRASMPKCTLQQLKDSILEGTHKYVATLKDISGLSCKSGSETIPLSDGDRNALPHMHTLTQSNEERGNSVSQILGDGRELLEKVPLNLNPSPSSRNMFELGSEKVVEDVPESQYILKTKKRKHCESSAITAEDETCQNFTSNEKEKNSVCPSEPQTLSAAPQKRIHHEIHDSSGTPKHNFQTITPKNASHDESQEKVITNKPKHETDDYREPEKLSGCNGYGNEKIDAVMPKNQFMSSHFTLGHSSSASVDWTERNCCVKCNEGGQLLVCNTQGCYMVVHEDCLGFSARFNNEGNFICPFCTYSVAISEYLEAKKKTSLARKRLASFVSPNFEHRSNGLAEGVHRKEGNPRQGKDEDLEAGQKEHLGETEGNQTTATGGHLNDPNNNHVHQCVEEDLEDVQNEHPGETKGNQATATGDQMNEVKSSHVQQCVDGKQRSEPLVSFANINLLCTEENVDWLCTEEGNVGNRSCLVSSKEQGEDVMDEGFPDVRGSGEEDNLPPPANHRCDNSELPSENKEVSCVIWRRIKKRGVQNETSDSKNGNFFTSIDTSRGRRQEKDYRYPKNLELRRTRLPFTAEEEEIIKLGVSKFSNHYQKSIPWKAILEFGAKVFLKGRTTMDIKDKWRNMCKGNSNCSFE